MEREFELLSKYMKWWIDRLKPMTLQAQIKIYSEKGYIEEGRRADQLPTFEQWKKIYY